MKKAALVMLLFSTLFFIGCRYDVKGVDAPPYMVGVIG